MILVGQHFKNGECKGVRFDRNGEARVGKYSKDFLDELKRFGIVPKTGKDAEVLESEKPPVVKTEATKTEAKTEGKPIKEAANEVVSRKDADAQKKPEKAEENK